MKIARKTLLSAFGMLAKIVENRPTLPLLSCVVLRQEGSHLSLQATDLDRWLSLLVMPTTPDPELLGAPIAIPAKEFLAVLKSLDDEVVSLTSRITTGGDGLIEALLDVNGIRVSTVGLDTEFPSEPQRTGQTVTIPHLTAAIRRVAGAVSGDESRYGLTGVYVNAEQGDVVATDGHRLYRAVIAPGAGLEGIILSGDLANLIDTAPFRKFVIPDILHVTKAPAQAFIPIEGPGLAGWLSARMIEGTFPKYEAFIPNDTSTQSTLTIGRDGLLTGLTKAMVLAEPRTRRVDLILTGGRARIHAQSERGEATFDLPGTATGEDLVLGFNGHNLKHAIESCTGDTVTLRFTNGVQPVWLHDGEAPTKQTPATWAFMRLDIVIMPMRTGYTLPNENEGTGSRHRMPVEPNST